MIRISRQFIGFLVDSQCKVWMEAVAFALIIRHDYKSGNIKNKDMATLQRRAGVGRDKFRLMVDCLEDAGHLRRVRKNYWEVGKLPKFRGKTRNIIIDEDICDFTSVKTVIDYLYASLLQVKKDQLVYNSSLKFKAKGYDVNGGMEKDPKTVRRATKRLAKLGYDETSLPQSGFEAVLARHYGQSYNTVAKTLGFSRSKAVYFMKSLEEKGLILKKKTRKLVYKGKDAALVLKYKYEDGSYTANMQSYVFLNKERDAILANFSNEYAYNLRS